MSGHSKWATIKRQKGAADAKRGAVFTKLSNAITIAVRQGGGVGDPESNFKLRLAVDQARAANMPKENIQRAIDRASGVGGAAVEELVYEGFAPGGVAVIVETVTDNKMRTVSEVKNILEKNGGTMGNQGSVAYLFKRRGEFEVEKNGRSSDDLLSIGINAGVEDMEEGEDSVYFYVDPTSFAQVKKEIENQNIQIDNAAIVYAPLNTVDVEGEVMDKISALIDKLMELDDVQQVYTNLG